MGSSNSSISRRVIAVEHMPRHPSSTPTAPRAAPRFNLAVTMRDARLASIDRPRQERNGVLVKEPEDVAFVQQLVARVTEWMQVSGEWVGSGRRVGLACACACSCCQACSPRSLPGLHPEVAAHPAAADVALAMVPAGWRGGHT